MSVYKVFGVFSSDKTQLKKDTSLIGKISSFCELSLFFEDILVEK